MISAELEEVTEYGNTTITQYEVDFDQAYIKCSLAHAASTFPYAPSLQFFMNEKIPALSDDFNNILTKVTKDENGNEVVVEEEEDKFYVIIGTTSNLLEHYKFNAPPTKKKPKKGEKAEIFTTIIDRLVEFYPLQFDASSADTESIRLSVECSTSIHIVVIGKLYSYYNRSKPKYTIKEKILAAVTFKPPTSLCTVVSWIAVESQKKYSRAEWHNYKASTEIIDDPPINCSGFGRFLLASVQQHALITKKKEKLILQSTVATFERFYHGIHFTEVKESDQNYEKYCFEMGETFIDSNDLFLFESNCHVGQINPSFYENKEETNCIFQAKENILKIYFSGIGIGYKKNHKLKNGTLDIIKTQFPNINEDSKKINVIFRHSVIVNDDSPQIIDEGNPIIANEKTLELLLNYKNKDSVHQFKVKNYPISRDKCNYSLYSTISNILFDKTENAKLIQFAVSYVYDVISRISENHIFFSSEDNAFFFNHSVKLLLSYRRRAFKIEKEYNTQYKDCPVNEYDYHLTNGCKKELFKFLGKDTDYEMRHEFPIIALMDLAVLSSIFNIQFVLFQAMTNANPTLAFKDYNQRAWREQVQCIPKLNITLNDVNKSSIHFVALSSHESYNYGYISIEKLQDKNPFAIFNVQALAKEIKNEEEYEKAQLWINDRSKMKEHKLFPATEHEWQIMDIMTNIDTQNILPFLRMIDPYAVRYRQYNPNSVLSVDGKYEISYESFRSLRPKNWLKEYVIDAFLKALSTKEDVITGKILLVSSTDLAERRHERNDIVFDMEKRADKKNYNYATRFSQAIIEKMNKADMVYIIVHSDNGHYFVVEFNMQDAKKNQRYDIYIADSWIQTGQRDWREFFLLLTKLNILSLLNEVRPGFAFEFFDAKFVSKQPDCYECGVHCCRRLYSKVVIGKIIDPKIIDDKIGSPLLFRLIIANIIIKNASYLTLYASETGTYPVSYDSIEVIPMPIKLKIPTYKVIRETQYPTASLINEAILTATNKELILNEGSESLNPIYNTNQSYMNETLTDNTSEEWSLSINSGDKYHNNKFGIDKRKITSEDINEVKSSGKQPPKNIKFDMNVKPINLDDEANKKRKNDSDKNHDSGPIPKKRNAATVKKIKALLQKETIEYQKHANKRDCVTVRKGSKVYFSKQPRRKNGDIIMSLTKDQINERIKDWDEPKLSSYPEHLTLGLVEKQKEEEILKYKEPKIIEVIEKNSDTNENSMRQKWDQLYFNNEQYARPSEAIDKIKKAIDDEITEARSRWNSFNSLYAAERLKKKVKLQQNV